MTEISVKEDASLEVLVGHVADEFLRRQTAGERPDIEEYVAQHPEAADVLRKVLASLQLFDASLSGAGEPGASGDVLAGPLGDFRLIREVGRGGMGIVYEAEQISLGRRVALKVLPFAATMDPRHLQRFHNEARAAAGLHHTNIVPVYGVGSERGVHYYAMQFIEGQTLAVLIAEQRQRIGQASVPADQPTTPYVPGAPAADTAERAAASTERPRLDAAFFRRAAGWGIQAAEALDHAHQMGIVHRDVKPANLLVDVTGRLWVTDFGLAQVQSDVRVTMTGDLVGTLRYMSPEQALAKRVVVDHCTDVYSLGATLYELLTLRPAFEGSDRQELLRQIAFEEPTPPRRLDRSIPGELETIVVKAMEKNPRDRYPTAQELADDLRRFLEDRPIRARRPSVLQRLRKLTRRHRAVVTTAAACLLVALVALGGGAGWVFNDRAARQREAGAKVRDAESRVEEALETAEPLLREGNPANLALVSAVQRVQAQLDSSGIGPEMRWRAEQLLRDVRMLADLDEIRLREAETNDTNMKQFRGSDHPGRPLRNAAASSHSENDLAALDNETNARMNEEGRFDHAGTALRCAAAFSQYGIDVLALDPGDAAARIRASAIHEALLAGLDGWLQAKPKEDPDRARLRQVADAADDSAWRRAFREAALASDEPKLKILAGQPEALAQPPAVLAWMGAAMRWRLAIESVALLRQAQRRHPEDFWINYNLGNALMALQPPRAEEAISYFRAAIAVRPRSAEAHSFLGRALFVKGAHDDAIAAYQQALSLDPRFQLARVGLAEVFTAQGKLDEVFACYTKAVELDPKNGEGYDQLGEMLMNHGKLDEAIVAFKEGLRLAPDFKGSEYLKVYKTSSPNGLGVCFKTWIFYRLGEALRQNGRLDEAIVWFQEAIRAQPDYYEPHNCLGIALSGRGRYKEAEAAFRKAIELDPTFAILHRNLGVALYNQRRHKEAEAEYREAIRLTPDWVSSARSENPLGNALHAQGRYKEAEAAYRKALELDPKNPILHSNLGNALVDQGRSKEAEAEYREAIRLNKDNADAYYGLGVALSDQGRDKEAEAQYREAIRLKPDFPGAHNRLGTALYSQGRSKEAEAAYRKAIELDPKDATPHCNLGGALYNQGRPKEAEAECREALKLKADDPDFHAALGDALEAQRDCKGAAAAFSEAIKLQPENCWYWVRRGQAYAGLGQWEKASADFTKGTECKQPGAAAWYSKAMLCLHDGNLDGYRKVCADMLQRFGKADEPDAGYAAWTSALTTNAGADPAHLVLLAEKAVAKSPKEHWDVNLLGAALYRAGRFDEAVKRLTEATALNADPYRTNMLYTWFFLAMAHHRLGHADEARRWLEKAAHATEEALKPPAGTSDKSSMNAPGTIPPNWNRKLTLQLLRREAEELIQGPGTKSGK
jgi:tetratricopeptide (TPR) repeat protein